MVIAISVYSVYSVVFTMHVRIVILQLIFCIKLVFIVAIVSYVVSYVYGPPSPCPTYIHFVPQIVYGEYTIYGKTYRVEILGLRPCVQPGLDANHYCCRWLPLSKVRISSSAYNWDIEQTWSARRKQLISGCNRATGRFNAVSAEPQFRT